MARVWRWPTVVVVARRTGGGVRDPARRPSAGTPPPSPGGARRRVLPGRARAPRRSVGGEGPPGERFAIPIIRMPATSISSGRARSSSCSARRAPHGPGDARRVAAPPAAPADVRARQAAVHELAPRSISARTWPSSAKSGGTVRRDALADVDARAPPSARAFAGRRRVSAMTLRPSGRGAVGWLPPIVVLAALASRPSRLAPAAHVLAADRALAGHAPDLALLADLLARLERASLGARCSPAAGGSGHRTGDRPSQAVRAPARLVDLLDAWRNQFFAPSLCLPSGAPTSRSRSRPWRARLGAAVAEWLAAVGELEALGSLAGYAWEHPADAFPIVEEGGPASRRRRSAIRSSPRSAACATTCARRRPRVLIVSGSNMSGKSTLLRAVGVNAVLAQAGPPCGRGGSGSPARGRRDPAHPDSLQDGRSRSTPRSPPARDRRLAEGPFPLLFLLDEILSGTNSHDRRLGRGGSCGGCWQRGASAS